MEQELKFALGQRVRLVCSSEEGSVEGRAEYLNSEPIYWVRYLAGDGRQVESWWGESALSAA